jgi:hypothetical protein
MACNLITVSFLPPPQPTVIPTLQPTAAPAPSQAPTQPPTYAESTDYIAGLRG